MPATCACRTQRTKVVVLDFYETWCEPAATDSASGRSAKALWTQGLQIVGLNVAGRRNLEQIPSFARDLDLLSARHSRCRLENLMNDEPGIPQTFVIDRHGVILRGFVRYDDSMEENWRVRFRCHSPWQNERGFPQLSFISRRS